MDDYCTRNVLYEIYGYMTWMDLRKYKDVPDSLWQRWLDYLCQDKQFENVAIKYWGRMMWRHKSLSYKRLTLGILDSLAKYPFYPSNERPYILKQNKDYIMYTMKVSRKLEFITDFSADPEVALLAISISDDALAHRYKQFKSDKNFMLQAVQTTGFSLMYASKHLKRDQDLVYAATRQLKIEQGDYRSIVRTALDRGRYFNYEDMDLICGDVELMALYESYNKFTGDNMLKVDVNDTSTILDALDKGRFIWNNHKIIERVRKDREFSLQCVKRRGRTLSYMGKFWEDPEIVLTAIQNDRSAIWHVSPFFLKNKKWMLQLLHMDKTLWMFADNDLKCDADFIRDAWGINI